jgi:hypothetical protein
MVTDLETFLYDHSEDLFSFMVYKKMFTPFEIERCYRDENVYTDISYQYGYIEEAVALPDGDVLLGIIDEDLTRTQYYKLSEIELSLAARDENDEE